MDSKLTLKLDTDIINKAKYFSKKHHYSISKLVEEFLKNLVYNKKSISSSPIVDEITGVVKNKSLPDEDDKFKYLSEKYA